MQKELIIHILRFSKEYAVYRDSAVSFHALLCEDFAQQMALLDKDFDRVQFLTDCDLDEETINAL